MSEASGSLKPTELDRGSESLRPATSLEHPLVQHECDENRVIELTGAAASKPEGHCVRILPGRSATPPWRERLDRRDLASTWKVCWRTRLGWRCGRCALSDLSVR
jgi:hypothetical protein